MTLARNMVSQLLYDYIRCNAMQRFKKWMAHLLLDITWPLVPDPRGVRMPTLLYIFPPLSACLPPDSLPRRPALCPYGCPFSSYLNCPVLDRVNRAALCCEARKSFASTSTRTNKHMNSNVKHLSSN